jgi:hypothetical protein
MIIPPLRPRLKSYAGNDATKRRAVNEENVRRHQIAEYLNLKIAADPEEYQQFKFDNVAIEMELTFDDVMFAIEGGGGTGLTVQVTPEARLALERLFSTTH